MHGRLILIAAWSAAFLAPAMAADECPQLMLLTSVQMTRADKDTVRLVPVSVEGKEKKFLLDTGGFISQLSASVASELKLPVYDSGMQLYDVNGNMSRKSTQVKDFRIGALHADKQNLQISPDKNDGLDGILSVNLFTNYDIDLDFGSDKLNYLSQDHCPGKVVYWPAQAVAVVPIRLVEQKIILPVTLDGQNLTATLDTGASHSTMSVKNAKGRFNLQPDSAGMEETGVMDGDKTAKTYRYKFHTLSFEGMAINNLSVDIVPDLMNRHADDSFVLGSHISRVSDSLVLPEILLGMDVLRHLHLYIAFGEKKLYITEASAKTGEAK